KWTGFTSSNSLIGDSTIFEDKNGLVGIGTDSPTSKLTVAGTIQITQGGLKFPDGSIQASAGALSHDPTLRGDGTTTNPLGVAVPLVLAGSVSNGNGIITLTNAAAGAPAIFASGGNSGPMIGGGSGLIALGGSGANVPGGIGIVGFGGNADAGTGGT